MCIQASSTSLRLSKVHVEAARRRPRRICVGCLVKGATKGATVAHTASHNSWSHCISQPLCKLTQPTTTNVHALMQECTQSKLSTLFLCLQRFCNGWSAFAMDGASFKLDQSIQPKSRHSYPHAHTYTHTLTTAPPNSP